MDSQNRLCWVVVVDNPVTIEIDLYPLQPWFVTEELTPCTVSVWPDNKEKCTELFDYCVTYTEEEPNPDKPFVTKVT